MIRIDYNKTKRELTKAAKAHNIKDITAITLIMNNIEIYNKLLDTEEINTKVNYLIQQVNGQIMKQLAMFKLLPKYSVESEQKEDEDGFKKMIKKLEKR